VREAADEVGGAIQRVDDPGGSAGVRAGGAPFLADEDVSREGAEEDLLHERLALAVGARDDVVAPLLLDLRRVERTEVPEEELTRAVGGLQGGVERARALHQCR
jgi:hypothetical protein